MRPALDLIQDQLQIVGMMTRGLYEHYCEEAGTDGPTAILEGRIAACKRVSDFVTGAIAVIEKEAAWQAAQAQR